MFQVHFLWTTEAFWLLVNIWLVKFIYSNVAGAIMSGIYDEKKDEDKFHPRPSLWWAFICIYLSYASLTSWFFWNCFPKQWKNHSILASWWLWFLGCWVSQIVAATLIIIIFFFSLLVGGVVYNRLLFVSNNLSYGFGQWSPVNRTSYNLVDTLTRHTAQVTN